MSEIAVYGSEIKQLKELHKQLETHLYDAIISDIKHCKPLDGVTVVSPLICTVKASTLMKEGKWGVDNIHPEVQVRNLMEYLLPKQNGNIDTLLKRIKEVADSGKYRIGVNTHYVNSNMLEVLRNIRDELEGDEI